MIRPTQRLSNTLQLLGRLLEYDITSVIHADYQ